MCADLALTERIKPGLSLKILPAQGLAAKKVD